MNKLLIGGALAALLIGRVAVAQAIDNGPGPGPGNAMDGGHGRHGGIMRMLDTNKDGSISLQEAIAAVTRHFTAVDTDHDGKISPAEMKTAHDKRRADMAARWGGHVRGPGHGGRFGPDKPGGPGGSGPGGPGARGGPGGPGAMLDRLDANGDGKLTRAEFDMPFDRMDANKDGVIDAGERDAVRQMMRRRMGPPPAPTDTPQTPKANTGQ